MAQAWKIDESNNENDNKHINIPGKAPSANNAFQRKPPDIREASDVRRHCVNELARSCCKKAAGNKNQSTVHTCFAVKNKPFRSYRHAHVCWNTADVSSMCSILIIGIHSKLASNLAFPHRTLITQARNNNNKTMQCHLLQQDGYNWQYLEM